jgi:hypothetical protein
MASSMFRGLFPTKQPHEIASGMPETTASGTFEPSRRNFGRQLNSRLFQPVWKVPSIGDGEERIRGSLADLFTSLTLPRDERGLSAGG